MANKATTINEQVEKLKSRGLVFDSGVEKVKEVLLDIGYYRLGFYWSPFEIDKDHNFKPGTKFSDVLALYYLDVDLKNILVRILNRIEINFKTQLIYFVSNQYDKDSIWFTNNKIVKNSFVEGFYNFYNKNIKTINNKPIQKHHLKYRNHKYAPAWKTIEFMSLGSTINLYDALLNESLKRTIAKQYDVLSLQNFKNYLKTIRYIRNICAHSDLLFDANTNFTILSSPQIPIENHKTHSLDTSIRVILYFLSQISKKRYMEYKDAINELFKVNSNNQVLKTIINNKIGYNKSY
jgi:abortive infection bacteriophage resistance protein